MRHRGGGGRRVVCAAHSAKRDVPLALTFIIPVLNGERFIGRCLEHLRQEIWPGDQVIVVDNGSKDGTLEIVRASPDVTVIEVPLVTIAGLRNRGAAAATNNVLAFIDADCLVEARWRESVERVLSDPAVSATGSYYDVPAASTWVERAWWSFRPLHEHRTTFLISGNFVVRKEMFDRVGGFDETLVTDEDTDISRRLIAAGAILIEAPSARVVHLGNAKTLRQLFRKEKWHATSILDTMRMHRVDRPMLLTFVFIACCVFAAAILVLGLAGHYTPIAIAALILLAPATTAAYKVFTSGNYRYFFHLLPLYLIVYMARTTVLVQALVRPARSVARPRALV